MNKTTVIALAFCLILFIIWYPLMYQLGLLQREESRPTEVREEESADAPSLTEAPADKSLSGQEDEAVPDKKEGAKDTADEEALNAEKRGEESLPRHQERAVKTPANDGDTPFLRSTEPGKDDITYLTQPELMTMSLDKDRGGVLDVELDRYQTYSDEENVILGNYRFPYCSLSLDNPSFELSQSGRIIEQSNDYLVIQRRAADDSLEVRERWELEEEGYRFGYSIELVNRTDEDLRVSGLKVGLGGLQKHAASDAILSRIGRVDLAAELAKGKGERPESYTVDDIDELASDKAERLGAEKLDWIALHNKYFLFYLAEDSHPFRGTNLDTFSERKNGQEDEQVWLYGQGFLPEVTLPAGEKEVIHFDGYAGPKEYERLTAIDRGLESIMRLDLFMLFRANWMSWISKTILRSLIFFRNIFPFPGGYGIAIIIVTIIIKLIFWPLTHKSTVSMRRMQKLQPLIKEIREKYKDDAQKMNRKVMELYREHKVNPLGGCLPILFQIPVFFALFNTLRGAIELRQASFLWVADLSMPDTLDWMPLGLPLRPLAILMAGTMFLQQKMSPSSSDPTQKRMMYFMTLFFMFIFYTMPAGLTLYWTTNQILTIIQNLFISKKESSEEKGN